MELTVAYILSQAFTIINYILLGVTYYLKDRKAILLVNILSAISMAIAYIFLGAYTGLAMCAIAIMRNLIFILDEKKNGKSDKILKKDIIILVALYFFTVILAIITYNGIGSLLSVFATLVFTYAVWQKQTKIYKILGVPTSTLWVCYNIYIKSIAGICLECVILICSIIGYILEIKEPNR